jgi:translocation and assembly module TamB
MSNQDSSNKSKLFDRLLTIAKRPSTLIIGVTTLALGAVGYTGAKILIAQKLPPIIEEQLNNVLDRPVKVGSLDNISLSGAEVKDFLIPATGNDSDFVKIPDIKVAFQILPVIFRRTLPVEITLIKPEIYLDQDKQGNWVKLKPNTKPGEESIYVDTKVNVEEGKITVVPYQKRPLIVPVDGSGRYNPNPENKQKQIIYDFKTKIAAAGADIKGNTFIETGKTDAKVLVKNLVLADVVPLIPNSPVDVNRGRLNANLDINLPSIKQIESARIQGDISLDKVEAEAEPIPTPIEAISKLIFGGDRVDIQNTRSNLGDVVAKVGGNLNLKRGYDVNVNVMPFEIDRLAKDLALKMPVPMNGSLQASLKLTGEVNKPKLTGNISTTEPLQVDKTKFKSISTNFEADLQKFVLKALEIQPDAGGEIKGTGIINTNIDKLSQKKGTIAWEKIPMAFNFEADLPTEKLVSPYYSLPSAIRVGQIKARGKVGGTAGNPLASLNWESPLQGNRQRAIGNRESGFNIVGGGEVVLLGKDFLLRNTKVKVGEGEIDVSGKGNLENKKWQTLISTKSIPINPFLSEIKSPQLNLNQPIALQDGRINLAGTLDANVLDKLDGNADLNLKVASGDVKLNSKLNAGNVKASLSSDRLPIEKFINNLPLPIALQTSQVDVSGKLKQLLSFNTKSPSLNGWQANAEAKLAVAEGIVDAKANLKNNLWQTDIDAEKINSSVLSSRFLPKNNQQLLDLPNLNAKAKLSGNLTPLWQSNFNTAIDANKLFVRLGNQAIDANGTIFLSKLANKQPGFDVASNLDVTASTDLDTLPVRKNLLDEQKVNLKGDTKFQGELQGKNLLSAPLKPGNLQLKGDLTLMNVAVNKIIFDPIVAGKIDLASGKNINLDLKGKQDRIAARFSPCNDRANKCTLPYFPEYIDFRTGEGRSYPVVAAGKRDRDNFNLNIQNFPLALLNISPATTLGIVAPVGGNLTGDVNVNLANLSANGNINIDKPALSYIATKQVNVEFDYDRPKNFAQLTSASLLLGDSKYDLEGDLDLNTKNVRGRLNIPEAYIQDLLTTLRWFDIESLTKLFQNDYKTKAIAIQPGSIKPSPTVSDRINLLAKIEENIESIADRKQAGDIPTLLDIRGKYTGEANLDGTLTNPQVDFKVAGNSWRWRTQSENPAIVNPLGLIKEGKQDIPIDLINIQGKFVDGIASLQPSEIRSGKAIVSMEGKLLSDRQADATVNIKNLSVDFLRNFTQIPVDVNGKIDSALDLKGTVASPKINGNIAFTDAVVNASVLPGAIAGEFNYDGSQFEIHTTDKSIVTANASFPYPIVPGTKDRFDVGIQLGTDTIALINPLTQGQLSWKSGTGDVKIQAGGRIDLNTRSKIYDLTANGVVNLDKATLKTKTYPSKIEATGKILLKDSLVEVEQLQGKIAKRNFSLSGILPIQVAQRNITNPLTLNLEKGKIEVEDLYEGGIEGDIRVTGSVFTPVIAGKVSLFDGNASIPQASEAKTNKATNPEIVESDLGVSDRPSKQNAKSFIVAKLDNFKVKLDNFKIQQASLYKINVGTAFNDKVSNKNKANKSNPNPDESINNKDKEALLTLNGTIDNPTTAINNIKARGTIEIRRADVDFLSNEFRLKRSYKSLVNFNPKRSILNPDLDIQLTTQVSDLANFRQAESNENEIPDSISKSTGAKLLDVYLNIQGQASKLLASLGQNNADICQINNGENLYLGDRDIFNKNSDRYIYNKEKIEKVEDCLQNSAYSESSNSQLLNAPIVKLTSSPSRSQGEIVSLLGNQFIELAKKLQNSNQDELLDFAASQFVLKPISREVNYFTEETVNNIGRKVGLDYLRLYPAVQGVYELNKDNLVDLTYDYFVDEYKVRYEWRF